MGKKLIIKDADFSVNAIFSESGSGSGSGSGSVTQSTYIPQTVINANGNSFFIQGRGILIDDVNELSGKTITGFDLLFVNKCSGQTMGERITFNPGTEQEIVCNINCTFETQDKSEQKIIHYKLPKPYTFKINDILNIELTGATFTDDSNNVRGGCSVPRVDRPNNTPNFAFLVKIGTQEPLKQYSYQPFMKLYLL